MKVFVNIYSTLRHHFDPRPPLGEPIEMEINPDETIQDIVERLGLPSSEVAIIMLNHNHAKLQDTVDKDNSRLGLFPVSGGG